MNLYGGDMDETTSPLESGLGWTIAWEPAERAFIGREVLEKQRRDGAGRKLVGLLLEDRGVLRGHQKVLVEGVGEGEVTSGSFSPTSGTLDRSGPGARRDRRHLRGRDTRTTPGGARGQAAVRAPR